MELMECPFCGRKPEYSGDDCIYCICGASVSCYGRNETGDTSLVAAIWNERFLSVNPQILKTAKIPDLHSAYTDLCSAQWKINKRSCKDA